MAARSKLPSSFWVRLHFFSFLLFSPSSDLICVHLLRLRLSAPSAPSAPFRTFSHLPHLSVPRCTFHTFPFFPAPPPPYFLLGISVSMVWSGIWSFLILKFLGFCFNGIRVSLEAEREGLGWADHGSVRFFSLSAEVVFGGEDLTLVLSLGGKMCSVRKIFFLGNTPVPKNILKTIPQVFVGVHDFFDSSRVVHGRLRIFPPKEICGLDTERRGHPHLQREVPGLQR
jgi:hypothetical protein